MRRTCRCTQAPMADALRFLSTCRRVGAGVAAPPNSAGAVVGGGGRLAGGFVGVDGGWRGGCGGFGEGGLVDLIGGLLGMRGVYVLSCTKHAASEPCFWSMADFGPGRSSLCMPDLVRSLRCAIVLDRAGSCLHV